MKFSDVHNPWDFIDDRQRDDLAAAMVRERAAMRAHRDYQRATTAECSSKGYSPERREFLGTCLEQLGGPLSDGQERLSEDKICPRCQEVARLKFERYQAQKGFRRVRDRIWRRLWKLVASTKVPEVGP